MIPCLRGFGNVIPVAFQKIQGKAFAWLDVWKTEGYKSSTQLCIHWSIHHAQDHLVLLSVISSAKSKCNMVLLGGKIYHWYCQWSWTALVKENSIMFFSMKSPRACRTITIWFHSGWGPQSLHLNGEWFPASPVPWERGSSKCSSRSPWRPQPAPGERLHILPLVSSLP